MSANLAIKGNILENSSSSSEYVKFSKKYNKFSKLIFLALIYILIKPWIASRKSAASLILLLAKLINIYFDYYQT